MGAEKAETPGGWAGIGRSVCDFAPHVNQKANGYTGSGQLRPSPKKRNPSQQQCSAGKYSAFVKRLDQQAFPGQPIAREYKLSDCLKEGSMLRFAKCAVTGL
jgi:hypothetical protein